MYGHTLTFSYPALMVLGNARFSKLRNTVQGGNGLPSLFPVYMYALNTACSVRADWISSFVIPSRESMLTTPLRDAYYST
jgi:hypothetical protein